MLLSHQIKRQNIVILKSYHQFCRSRRAGTGPFANSWALHFEFSLSTLSLSFVSPTFASSVHVIFLPGFTRNSQGLFMHTHTSFVRQRPGHFDLMSEFVLQSCLIFCALPSASALQVVDFWTPSAFTYVIASAEFVHSLKPRLGGGVCDCVGRGLGGPFQKGGSNSGDSTIIGAGVGIAGNGSGLLLLISARMSLKKLRQLLLVEKSESFIQGAVGGRPGLGIPVRM